MVIITERINPDTFEIDLKNGEEIAQIINKEDLKIANAISEIIPQIGQAIEIIADSLKQGGRLAYFGAGTSGRIGILDASEMSPTFGVSPDLIQGYIAGGEEAIRHSIENAEDSAELAMEDLNKFQVTPNDVVVGISACGNPLYVITVLKQAKNNGATTIAISSNPDSEIKKHADIFLNPIVGPEVITGSSRMKSGTAQKMILNMLSTGVMIRLGKTYRNYMVDLQMNNNKLIKRAIRFVCDIANTDEETAEKVLAKVKNVKVACVMIAKNINEQEAKALLNKNEGILRKIIE